MVMWFMTYFKLTFTVLRLVQFLKTVIHLTTKCYGLIARNLGGMRECSGHGKPAHMQGKQILCSYLYMI